MSLDMSKLMTNASLRILDQKDARQESDNDE